VGFGFDRLPKISAVMLKLDNFTLRVGENVKNFRSAVGKFSDFLQSFVIV
jgi:hypothetical protein